jgi:hypothetical protein
VPSCILQDRTTQLFVKKTDRLRDINKLEVSSWTALPAEAQRYSIEPIGEAPGSNASPEEIAAFEEKKLKTTQRFEELRSLGSDIVLLWL